MTNKIPSGFEAVAEIPEGFEAADDIPEGFEAIEEGPSLFDRVTTPGGLEQSGRGAPSLSPPQETPPGEVAAQQSLLTVRQAPDLPEAPVQNLNTPDRDIGTQVVDAFERAYMQLQVGLNQGSAGGANMGANALMLLDMVADGLVMSSGGNPSTKGSWLSIAEAWLREQGRAFQENAEAHQVKDPTIPEKVIEGLGSAPSAIAQYALGIKALGPIFGFAGVDALGAADQGAKEAAIAGGQGLLIGKMFHATNPLNRIDKAATLGLVGGATAAAEGGTIADITAGAVTLATLGATTKPGNLRVRDLYTHESVGGTPMEKGSLDPMREGAITPPQPPAVKTQASVTSTLINQGILPDLRSSSQFKKSTFRRKVIVGKPIEGRGLEIETLEKVLAANKRGSKFKPLSYVGTLSQGKRNRNFEMVTEQVPVKELLKMPGNKTGSTDMRTLEFRIKSAGGLEEPVIITVGKESRTAVLGEGNHRVRAARNMGFTHVPTRVQVQMETHTGENDLIPKSGEYFSADAKPSNVFRNMSTADKDAKVDPTQVHKLHQLERLLSEAKAGKFMVPGKQQVINVTDIRDIDHGKNTSNIRVRTDLSSSVAPGKFVGDLHPLLKWGIDNIDGAIRRAETNARQILWAPELKTGTVGTTFGLTARRSSTFKPTDKGAMTGFADLPTKSQIKTLEFGWKWDTAAKEATNAQAKAAGLSDIEIAAYRGLRRGTEAVRETYNGSIARSGMPNVKEIPARPGYLPRMWEGNYRIFAKGKDGILKATLGANTRMGAKRAAEDLQKRFPDLEISSAPVKIVNADRSTQAFRDAIMTVGKNSPEAIALELAYGEVLAKRGFSVHKRARTGVEGYLGGEGGKKGVKNFIRAYEGYVEGGIKSAEMSVLQSRLNKTLGDKDVARSWPNASEALDRHKRNALGEIGPIDKALMTPHIAAGLGGVRQATLINMLMFGNMRFLMVNALQPYLVVPAKLLNLKGKGIESSVNKAITYAEKDFFLPSEEAKMAIRHAFKNGVVNPKFIKEGIGNFKLSGEGAQPLGKAAVEFGTGQRLAGRVEEYVRMKSYLMFYHFLRNGQVSKKKSMEGASFLTDKYLVEYTSNTRPLIYGSLIGGEIGRNIGLFKTFQNNYLGQQVEYIKAAKGGHPAGLVAFVGAQIMTAGLLGIVGREGADMMLQAIGQPTLSQMILENTSGEYQDAFDYLTWGIPSASLDMDLTSTAAAPGLAPQDFVSFPGFEYGIDAGAALTNLILKKYMNPSSLVTPLDEQRFWLSVSPTPWKGMIEKHYSHQGRVLSSSRGGIATFNRTGKDWFKRHMSSRSLEESRAMKALWQMTLIDRRAQNDIKGMVDATAWAWMQDIDAPGWVWDRALDLGMTPSDFNASVNSRMRKLTTDLIDTVTNMEMTMKGFEKGEKFRSMGVGSKISTGKEGGRTFVPVDVSNDAR